MKGKRQGAYLLVIRLKESQRISVGNHPEETFKAGVYLYIGRDKRNVDARIARHLRKKKKHFWHIDYLLEKAIIEDVWIRPHFYDECQTVRRIRDLLGDSLFTSRKFGSSDCSCYSHLVYLPKDISDLTPLRKTLSFERMVLHGD